MQHSIQTYKISILVQANKPNLGTAQAWGAYAQKPVAVRISQCFRLTLAVHLPQRCCMKHCPGTVTWYWCSVVDVDARCVHCAGMGAGRPAARGRGAPGPGARGPPPPPRDNVQPVPRNQHRKTGQWPPTDCWWPGRRYELLACQCHIIFSTRNFVPSWKPVFEIIALFQKVLRESLFFIGTFVGWWLCFVSATMWILKAT